MAYRPADLDHTTDKLPELLAPAGDFEKLITVLHYGADAVYLGPSKFSLRHKADNFESEEIIDAINYCHRHNKRVYVTINIFPHNRDIEPIRDYLHFLRDLRPDGLIISDLGVFRLSMSICPEIPIHISTQANITNTETAKFWQDMGAKRLILARELSLDEIRQIREAVTVELEVFVHGSICISYSGRCYISSFLAYRSANQGLCTNSCRWNYTLMEEKRPGHYMPVFEDDRGTYLMSSKDLCLIEHIDKLVDAGIESFKIEGRIKGINYAGGVVKVYREAIDSLKTNRPYVCKESWKEELAMFSSRGYTTGMLFGRQPDEDYNFDGLSYRMTRELVGVVKEVNENKAVVSLRNRLDMGDRLEFLILGSEPVETTLTSMYDSEGNEVSTARNEDTVIIEVPKGVRPNDLIRRPTRP